MKTRNLTDYFRDSRRLDEASAERKENDRTVRISVATSFTTKGMKEVLAVSCDDVGIRADVYESGYNEYWQDLLDPGSPFYSHDPDLIVVFVELRDVMGELYWRPYEISDDERKSWVADQAEKLGSLVQSIKSCSGAKILLHNFEVPVYSPMGILEGKSPFGIREAVQTLNGLLRDMAKTDSQLFIFDYDLFCSSLGKAHVLDPRMYYLGDIRLDWEQMPALCRQYLGYVRPLASDTRKCIVLDLDNTLWGGVVGEDGLQGIHLGPTPEGRPYWEFQKLLLGLWQRGIILAVNSKNNLDDALNVLREHPSMVLREEHFAAIRINWRDKGANLVELADELSLGLDSLVFIDDDEIHRERIRSAFPEVFVVDLPDDAALYPATLMRLDLFNTLQLTGEDLNKGKLYSERKQRERDREAMSLEDHLSSLETVVTIRPADSSTIPRISQLTQKTNQFNLTTRRYQDEDIERFARDPAYDVICCSVRDKFGENGITGVAIVEKLQESWRIDTLLLSCRVIGRGIEEALLSHLAGKAISEGASQLCGEFVRTPKNTPAKDFYRGKGFSLERTANGTEWWIDSPIRVRPVPDFLTLLAES